MRLLFFSGGSYVAGMEIVNLELMRQLNKMGIPVHAVISGWNDGLFPKMLHEASISYTAIKLGAIIRGNPFKVPLSWTIDALYHAPGGLRALSRLCSEFRPTHIIHTEYQYAFVVIAALGSRYKHVLHAHEAIGPRLARPRGTYVVKRCSSLICVSDFVRQGILRSHPDCNAKVVHNGCRPICLSNKRKRECSSTIFGIVGQISPHKNVELAARAVHRARLIGLDCVLKIFGNDNNDYARHVRSQEYSGIQWMGFVEDRNRIYSEIDCLISACSEEPYGTTIIEAMSAGIPVIAADGGGSGELVTHEKTGLLFVPGNEESLAACVSRMSNQDVREEYGMLGKKYFEEMCTIEAMATNFLKSLS